MSETILQSALRRLDEVPPQTRIEVLKGVTIRRKKKGLTVLSLHYSAVPSRDPSTEEGRKWYDREHAKYSTEAMWKKEQEIDPDATGGEAVFGRILSEFYSVVVISDPHWFPDPRWDVVGGFDHGVANATCLLKAYIPQVQLDPVTGRKLPPEVYVCGEYYSYRRDDWENNVDQNVQQMKQMPDMDRARWIMGDPAIFWKSKEAEKGAPTNTWETYRKNNMWPVRQYDGIRSDVTFVQWMLSDYWRGVCNGKRPRLFIVCRNPSDAPQPGLHPYDCPNLVWELKRAKRVEMTSRQLLTQNQKENLQDKNNHARDCLKYLTGLLRNPAEIDPIEAVREEISKLDPFTANIRARFLLGDLSKLGPDGKLKKKGAKQIDMRLAPGGWEGMQRR